MTTPRRARRFADVSLLALIGTGSAAVPAAAQSPPEEARVFLAADGGIGQVPGFRERLGFEHPLFGPEAGELDADYGQGRGLAWELRAGVRVRGNFALGIAGGRFAPARSADLTGLLPHPFVFDQPRSVAGTAESLTHGETAVDLEARWVIEAGRSLEITLFAGPSLFRITTERVEAIRFDQAYPYTEAAFADADRQEWTTTLIGGHAGADAAWYLSGALGLGGTIRYRSASGDLDRGDGFVTPLEAGGLQALAGVRLRF